MTEPNLTTSVKSRILFLQERLGLTTQEAFASHVGVVLPTIKGILRNDKIGRKSSLKIAKALNISHDWIKEGLGHPPFDPVKPPAAILSAQPVEVHDLQPDPDMSAYVWKAKAKLSAGGGLQAEEGFEAVRFGFLRSWLHQKATAINDDTLFLIDIEGDSMLDTFVSGDMVLVDQGRKELRNEGVFAIGEGDFLNIKRLKREDNLIHIISDSKDKILYPTRTVQGETLRIFGRVIWVAREIP